MSKRPAIIGAPARSENDQSLAYLLFGLLALAPGCKDLAVHAPPHVQSQRVVPGRVRPKLLCYRERLPLSTELIDDLGEVTCDLAGHPSDAQLERDRMGRTQV